METRQNASRDLYGAGGGYIGRSEGPFYFEVDVTFIADPQGVYELQRASGDISEVSVVPGSTGYAEQCRRYEDEIAELKKRLEEVTRNLVKVVMTTRSLEQQRAQATKERDEAKKNADKEAGDAQLRAELKEAVRANGELLRQLQARRVSAPIGVAMGGASAGEPVSVDLSTIESVLSDGAVWSGDEVVVSRATKDDYPLIEVELFARKKEKGPRADERDSWMTDANRLAREWNVSPPEAMKRIAKIARDGLRGVAVERAFRKGSTIRVRVNGDSSSEETAVAAGEVEAGGEVVLKVRPGMAIRWEATSTGKEWVAPVRKAPPEPSRFTAIELDEDE